MANKNNKKPKQQELHVRESINSPFLDPTYDITFKRVFGNEEHKEITIDFLNDFLERPEGKRITAVNFANELPEVPQEFSEDSEVDEAFEVLRRMSFSKEDMFAYFKNQDEERVARSKIATAIAEGKAEGKAEGLAEGKAEGRQEGEAQKAVAIALNMLSKGMDINTIAEVTGLAVNEIKKL